MSQTEASRQLAVTTTRPELGCLNTRMTKCSLPTLHIVTGEFPPSPGGVSEYTQLIARALSAQGQRVVVWSTGDENRPEQIDGIIVQRSAGNFDRAGCNNVDRLMLDYSGPKIVLVQYTPHAYGFRAMNIKFANWIRSRKERHGDAIWTMFHEVVYPWRLSPMKHNLIALVTRMMARTLIKSSDRILASTSSWAKPLSHLGAPAGETIALPIPTNIPRITDQDRIREVRTSLQFDAASCVIGHFGTNGSLACNMLPPILKGLFESHSRLHFRIIGEGSDKTLEEFTKIGSNWGGRMSASGRCSAEDISANIQACDFMLQPYGDGVNTRRSSLMACMNNGRTAVTNLGLNSEPCWKQDCGLVLAHDSNTGFSNSTRKLVELQSQWASLGEIARRYYDDHFGLVHTIESLLKLFPSHAHVVEGK
jgi:hypothetical protein